MTSSDTTTVRVRRPDSERLQLLARSRGTTVVEVVHAAVEALERQDFLEGLNGDYERLADDAKRLERYLTEREEWDGVA